MKDNHRKMKQGNSYDPKLLQQFKDLVNQTKNSFIKTIEGRSTISRDLSFE
jgi:ribosomal protein S19